MVTTTLMRAQQEAAEAMIAQILADISTCRTARDGGMLSPKLARLREIFRGHFAMEAQVLYPRMIESDHREAAITALVFRNERSHILGQLDRFIERWSSSAAIAAAVRLFEYEAGKLFAALRDRIHREERDLYPLAEQVSDHRKEIPHRGFERLSRVRLAPPMLPRPVRR